MTTRPQNDFHVTVTPSEADEVLLRLSGDLDYDSADELLAAARDRLALEPVPRVVRLDCARLTTCDSMGLATLLMIERIASDTGAALRLDGRPDFLRRLLEVTGTLDQFAPAPPAESPASADGEGIRQAQQADGRTRSDQGP
ncbi:Putative anti-sigma factor antagonist (modular protein) [Streptomyces ambofaciens ATCC 23877]|uniref:Putative anti-sigma factor antagonist (Modular protein) n=1 Tax=Streptomyces ambofaciens (strain ATCC 23877 / 3486 / DSM 40053 / JCM 4204 / NBRC 12836 / NRRL B-2516) TaxID=278992 RepID=A0A0K2APH9_STRA7|nr:STAS domain-containing protein [Streptomyces ambofaciens]AKZ54889.1 Putative anti-sigma factor antagonist (modular protein) [Streptomyces ambofaciens ATCC 23877]